MIERITAAALAAALALACASSAPPEAPRPECPATGPRASPALRFAIAGDAQRGAAGFDRECAGCHASAAHERAPDAPVTAPRLDCAEWLAAISHPDLYHAINPGPGNPGHRGPPPPPGAPNPGP